MTSSSPRRRSRIAHFKAPFVISLAAPAALGIACGGKTEPTDLDQTSIAGVIPVDGERCNAAQELALPDDICPRPICSGGRWAVPTCNPPPIAPENECVGAPPPPQDPSCYGGHVCEEGEWREVLLACNPPPPESDCAYPPPPTPGIGCSESLQCVDGEWIFSTDVCNQTTAACPERIPTGGESCAGYDPGLTCEYEFCYAERTPMVRCNATTQTWDALPIPTCNPPPPPVDAGAPISTDAGAPDGGG